MPKKTDAQQAFGNHQTNALGTDFPQRGKAADGVLPTVKQMSKWLFGILAAGMLLLVLIYLMRGPLISPYLIRLMVETAKTELGVQLEIGGISGTYLSRLEVTDLKTVQPNPAGPLVSLDLTRLNIRYSLLTLLRGRDDFLASLRIGIDGGRVFLMAGEDRSTSSKAPGVGIPRLPPIIPGVHISNSSVTIKGREAYTRFEGISLVTQPHASGSTHLQLTVSGWSWHHPALYDGSATLSGTATVSGENLTLERLDLGNGRIVASAGADLRQLPAALPFQAEVRISAGSVNLAGTWSGQGLNLHTTARRLDLKGLTGVVKLPFTRLGGILNLGATADLTTGSPGAATARLELSVADGRIDETIIDHLDLGAGLKDELLTIDHLIARAAGSEIGLKDIRGSAAPLFAGDFLDLAGRISGKFSLQSQNLPALLSTFGVAVEAVPATPAHALVLEGKTDRGTLTIASGRLTAAAGSLSVGPLQVQTPSAERPWRQSAIQGGGRADISALQPIGVLFGLPGLGGSLQADIQISGTLGAPRGRASIDGRHVAWRQIGVETLAVKASGDAERIAVDALEITSGRDRVSGQGAYHLSSTNLEGARLDLNITDPYRYIAMLAPAIDGLDPQKMRIDGHLGGHVLLSGPAARPDGVVDLKIKKLQFQSRHFGDAEVQLRKQGDRISEMTVRVENGRDNISIQGAIDLATNSAAALSLAARIDDIGRYTQGLVPPAWSPAGTVHIDAQASGPLRRPDARIQADLQQFKVGKIEFSAAALSAHSAGRAIHVDLAEISRPQQRLKLSGTLQNNWDEGGLAFVIDACDFQYHDLAMNLSHPARLGYTRNGSISFDRMDFQGPAGRVGVHGALAQKGSSDLQVEIADLTGAGWFEALAGDRARFKGLDAAIHITGAPGQPQIKADGSADSITLKGYPDPLSGEFDLSYTGSGISLHRLIARGPNGADLSLSAKFPVQIGSGLVLLPGPIEASGNFSIPDLKLIDAFVETVRFQRGGLKAEFELGGSWRQPDLRLQARGRDVDFEARWQPLPPGPYEFDCDLNVAGSRLTIKSVQLNAPSLSFTGQGYLSKIPSPADLIEKIALDPQGEVALEGRLVMPDMGWLARGVSSLRRIHGRLEADLRLTGSVAKPDFQTTVRITDGELHTNTGMPSLRAIDLNGRVNTLGLQLERLEARMGGAPVQASGTYKWNADDPRAVDLSVKGTNLLLFRDENILMRADADLKLKGPLERMALTGDMALTKGLVKKNLNIFGLLKGPGGPKSGPGIELFSLTEPPLRDLQFDVRLKPKAPIDIRGNIAQGSVRPELHLGGTGLLPVLKGNVYADTTRVSLPAGRVVIKSGVIRFLETDPEVPVLELNGNSRMLGYDISILVAGPYNAPEITLSSIPPLPGDALMLLLLTGQPPKAALGGGVRNRQNVQVAVYVAKDLMSGLFSSSSSEEIEDVLDRFDFQVGRDVTRSGDETIEAQFRVKSGLLLKRDRLYITGEKDAYDYFNTGIKLVFRFK